MNTNPYAPPVANVDDVAQASETPAPVPALWNPGAAASWGLLFGPIFGAILHMKNWQALGEPEKAAQSKKWVIACIVFLLMAVASVMLPDSSVIDRAFRAIGLAMLITWYFSSGRHQVRYVKERFGNTYPRKGWGLPLLYTFLIFIAFVAVMVGVAFVVELVNGEDAT